MRLSLSEKSLIKSNGSIVKDGTHYSSRDAALNCFEAWLDNIGWTGKILAAGKNFGSFDLAFLKRLSRRLLVADEVSLRLNHSSLPFMVLGQGAFLISGTTALNFLSMEAYYASDTCKIGLVVR